jgi:uncharacterized membrane protein YdjX (TVP38/TMEM64 family)
MYIKKYKQELGFIILIAALLILWYLGSFFNIDTKALQRSLEGYPLFFSGILFILLYVAVTFFVFFSKDLFWLMGAVLFGAYYSTLFIWASEIINAFILFYLARYLGRSYVDKSLKGRFKELNEKLVRVNFFWLFIFRAVPLVPYRFLDLTMGLTRIHFSKYLAAVILGTPFKTFWMQYILTGVGQNIYKNPYAVAEYLLSNKTLFLFSLIYILLVILVVLKIKHRD